MSFARKIGRFTPYGDYPYILAQNAKVREMNSLVQRDAANLYKQIADPFGQNQYGEFGTALTPTEAGAGQLGSTSLLNEQLLPKPLVPPTGSPDEGGPPPPPPRPPTPQPPPPGPGVEEEKDKYRYNSVTEIFAANYINIPWWSWKYSDDQQTAMNLLQANGDEMMLQYKAKQNEYPALAIARKLPCTSPKFSRLDYSDRQMIYCWFYRDPYLGFTYDDPGYLLYLKSWITLFQYCRWNAKNSWKGIDMQSFTFNDWSELFLEDTIALPNPITFTPNYYYQDIKNLSAAIPSYFTEDYVKAYKFDKTLFKKLQAEAQSKYSTNVFFDGTNDGYNPSDTRTLIPPYIQSMYYQVGMVEQAYKKSTDTPISFDYDERFY